MQRILSPKFGNKLKKIWGSVLFLVLFVCDSVRFRFSRVCSRWFILVCDSLRYFVRILFWLRTVLCLVWKTWLQNVWVLYVASTLSPVLATWLNAMTGNKLHGTFNALQWTHFLRSDQGLRSLKKSPYTYNGRNVDATLVHAFLDESSSFWQVTSTITKAWMSLNFVNVPSLTTELAALERLKKIMNSLVTTLAPLFLIGSSSFLQVTRTTINLGLVWNSASLDLRLRS